MSIKEVSEIREDIVPDAFNIAIGRKIRERRVLIGKTQTDIGEELGISFQQVQKYERGINSVPVKKLLSIASILGVEPDYFWRNSPSRLDTNIINIFEDKDLATLIKAYLNIRDKAIKKNILTLVKQISENIPAS